ncbi:hypothetical protein B5F83_00700 [Muribaculum sp. An289]|jgi:cytoskeletal protein CcmA (bactofilin family)|uniref:Polymer-forming cytoskeletal protein n=1 Tax=Candidatus Merdivivens faecigallinarum TaxID=2840871 RepID=A0A9D9IZC4_9BACT|nr:MULTISPECIES: polymer-forming cytoskeletal protein [unclassified Muribaculum]MBO8482002.1 polymer-forming cytoskeletal protein [Candidatus Merdivivens faecigallinarum]OUO38415.1 hypothetical protein B5F83_00700 [Muribaculum sp. An289]OUO43906.1 hypothetical protein B5F81_01675 [Muribaculum sp. An287]
MAKNEGNVNFNEISRLASSTELKGTMISSSDIRVDGRFEGSIITEGKVLVGETSEIVGDIIARSADIWGKVSGSVTIGDTLSLKNGCSLSGTAEIVKLSVEIGSIFNCTCRMITTGDFDERLKSAKGDKASAGSKTSVTSATSKASAGDKVSDKD